MTADQSITCQSGAHGFNPTYYEEELFSYYDPTAKVCSEPSAPTIPASYVEEWEVMSIPPELPRADQILEELCNLYPDAGVCKQASRQTWESDTSNTISTSPRIAVIHMGKAHIYPKEAWIDLGPQWLQNLITEGDLLVRRIETTTLLVEDWTNLHSGVMGTFVGGMSLGFAKFAALFEGKDVPTCPKMQDLKALANRAATQRKQLAASNAAVYREAFQAGKEFMLVAEEHDKLREAFEKHRFHVVEGAQGMVDVVLTPVEATAFTVLDMTAKVIAGGDPIREIAYRTGISIIHASTKLGAEALAGSRGKSLWMPLLQQLVADLPGIVVEGVVGRWLKDTPDGRLKIAMKAVVKESTSFFVDMLVYTAWDYDLIKPESDREAKMREWLNARIVKAVGGLLAGGIETLFNLPKDSPYLKQAASDAAQEISQAVLELWNKAREEHKIDANKKVWEVMLRDLPETLAKAIGTVVLRTALGEKYKGESEAKKANLDAETKRVAEEQKAVAQKAEDNREEQEALRAAAERARLAKPVRLKSAAVEVTTRTEDGKTKVAGKPMDPAKIGTTVPPKRQAPPKQGNTVSKADAKLAKQVKVVAREPGTAVRPFYHARKAARTAAERDQERAKAQAAFRSREAKERSRQKGRAKTRAHAPRRQGR